MEGGIPDEKTQRAVPHPVSGAVGRTSGAGHRKRRYVCRAGQEPGLHRGQAAGAAIAEEPAGGTGHGKCRAVRHARPG